jgi:outer membrane protein assembly factor BamD (BamD/ComL family)
MHKKFAEADRRYDEIIREHSNTSVVPEAIYWKWVSRYKKDE